MDAPLCSQNYLNGLVWKDFFPEFIMFQPGFSSYTFQGISLLEYSGIIANNLGKPTGMPVIP